MTFRPGYIWSGNEWVSFGPENVATIPYQASEPTSPQIGDLWIDSDGDVSPVDMNTYSTTAQADAKYSPITTTGLVLLSSTTFSAVSSVSINNCFSANFDNYKLVISAGLNGPSMLNFRLRTTTDYTAGNYNQGGWAVGNNNSSGTWAVANAATSAQIARLHTASDSFAFISMDVNEPYVSTKSTFWSGLTSTPDQGSTAVRGLFFGGSVYLLSSFTGFSLYPDSGVFTGSVKVYGYK